MPLETHVASEPSWVQGGERSCTKAAGTAGPSRGQLRRGAVGLHHGREEKQRTLSCQPRDRGSGGSGFGEPHGEGRVARGCGAGQDQAGEPLCAPSVGLCCYWGRWERGLEGGSGKRWFVPQLVAAQSLLSHLSISKDKDPPLDPAWGSPSLVPWLDPLALGTQLFLSPQHVRSTLSPPW